MILTCPNCGTQYVVKDGAIPSEGRQVRCAACKHSWHQDPEEGVAPGSASDAEAEPLMGTEPMTAPTAGEQARTNDAEETIAEAIVIDPRSGPESEERAFEESMLDDGGDVSSPVAPDPAEAASVEPNETAPSAAADWDAAPQSDTTSEDFSPFVSGDFVEERGRSPLATILIVILIILLAAAAFWFLAPLSLKAKLGLVAAGATPLQLVATHMDRTPLESGNDLLTVTGRVINPSPSQQDVPPIQAQLKNGSGKVVYSWTIQPPARSLAAGASASFNSAEVSVPPGAKDLTITLGNAVDRNS